MLCLSALCSLQASMAVQAFASPQTRRPSPAGDIIAAAFNQLLSAQSDPDSELTTIPSPSRKRLRKAAAHPMPLQQPPNLPAEIESLVHLHAEQLKTATAEIHRRYIDAAALAAESRIREKESQLSRLWQINAALQGKLSAVSLQSQQLLAAAHRSEAVTAALRANLELVVRQNDAAARDREGCGDSGEGAEDEASCCGGAEGFGRDQRFRCRVCGEREVSMLLLPCHHLCLCGDCEKAAGECPCCRRPKHAAVEVFLPAA